MKLKFRDTEIVFKDLSDAFCELKNERNSPVRVRRCFRNFFILSQQLTEVMRKEYKKLTSEKWEPVYFDGWNEVTDLFKRLRKSDYHQFPVLIKVHETQYYFRNGALMGVSFSRDLGTLFSDEIPNWIKMIEADPETGEPMYDKAAKPRARSFSYNLYPRTKEIENALKNTGTKDIHRLSEKCFETLKAYFDYYNNCVEVNKKP